MRVGYFTIATQDLKTTIEGHMNALSDGLTLSLLDSGKTNLSKLTEILTDVISKLDTQPQSLERICIGWVLAEWRSCIREDLSRQVDDAAGGARGAVTGDTEVGGATFWPRVRRVQLIAATCLDRC
jgi:hypothetical protein